MNISTKKKLISSTLLISLTDVIFLLLIFLMLVSNFVTQTGINVRLPGSSSGTKHLDTLIEIVYINDNEILFDNTKMELSSLKNVLPTYFKSKEQVVKLSADKEMSLQKIIDVMDIIRLSGFEKITIATNKSTSL